MSNQNKNNHNTLTIPPDFYSLDTNKSNSIDQHNPLDHTSNTNQKNYSLITFLNSKRKPDIYHGNAFLSGMNYINKRSETKEEEVMIQDDQEGEGEGDMLINENCDHLNEGKYEDMKNKNMRYFNFSQNITIKCFNCGGIGHMSKSCPEEQVLFCIKCNRIGHEDRGCPFTKCFKCNQYGHRSNNCPLTKNDLIRCERCDHIGHKGYDCLIRPMKITSNILKYQNASCYFCGSHEHVVCHFNKNKAPISLASSLYTQSNVLSKEQNPHLLSEEEGEIGEEERIFESISNDEIADCPFCPRCGHKHKLKYCKKEDRRNEFDERRLQFSNYMFRKTNYKDY